MASLLEGEGRNSLEFLEWAGEAAARAEGGRPLGEPGCGSGSEEKQAGPLV